MNQRSRGTSSWALPAWLVVAVLVLMPVSSLAAPAAEKEEKAEEKKEESTAKKPRVITNADLAKYGKRATIVSGSAVQQPPAPVSFEEEPPPPAAPPRSTLPPEDRLDGAALPELEERQAELQGLLSFLKAKAAWIKNPLLPQPTPPEGEVLLDPALSGGEELRVTRSRIFSVDGRLGKIRLLIQSGGGQAPVPEP